MRAFPIRPFGKGTGRVLALLASAMVAVFVWQGHVQAAPARAANPIDSLQPGHWLNIPNSNVSALDPCPRRNCNYSGVGGQSAVINAWSGGAFDTKRDRLVIWGGGHHDYAGNEVYAFDLNTLTWSRLTNPSSTAGYTNRICNGTGIYPDGRPVSRHTYGGMTYIPPPVDKLFSAGGATWPCGYGNSISWYFDFTTNTWQQRSRAPSTGYNDVMAYDPITGHVFNQAGGTHHFLSEYNPETDTWMAHGNQYSNSTNSAIFGALDPVDRLLVAVGGQSATSPGVHKCFVWKLGSAGSIGFTQMPTTGPMDVMAANAPGFAWDPDAQLFVAWVGGANIYMLDPKTWIWRVQTPAADNMVIPTAPATRGTFGRFQYSPTKKVFVLVNSVGGDVYVFRPSFGTNPK